MFLVFLIKLEKFAEIYENTGTLVKLNLPEVNIFTFFCIYAYVYTCNDDDDGNMRFCRKYQPTPSTEY
jgi:hypothetical protein